MLHGIFATQDGVPQLKIKASRLPGPKGSAAIEIAMLLMGARQASGIEDYTPVTVTRETAKEYGKFDVSNYASSLGKIDHLVMKRGRGANVERKLTRQGLEEAGKLVASYAAEKTA